MLFPLTAALIKMLGLSNTAPGIQVLATVPLGLRLLIPITAAITEEAIYRGYLIERLKDSTQNVLVAVILADLLFAAVHIPFWGLGGAIQIGIWALIPSALYVRRKNLTAPITAHFVNDMFAFVVLPLILK